MTKTIQQKLSCLKNDADNDKYHIAFSHLAEIAPIFKSRLYEFFDFDIKRAWECDKNDLKQFDYPVPGTFLPQRDKIDPDEVHKDIKDRGMKFITPEDPSYPALLKEIPDYPLVLYYQGELEECNFNRALAIVGSRKASESAKVALEAIVRDMAGTDILIISGLASGIDGTAHKAALDNDIKTIGVIASGLDIEYPNTNKTLYKRIREGGGVVMSEYPPKVPPLSHHFPQRNRIVTGMSYGTLVAEAALKSGAMISANLTLEQNRELMCMPGLISNPNTAGIYKLLKDGAHLVTTAEDIFETLNWEIGTLNQGHGQGLELPEDEKIILEIIGLENSDMEQIQAQSGFDTSYLMIILTALELKGLIKQIRGKYFIFGNLNSDGTE